ncbi:MAG: DegV family protein [Anaerolineae bacterium]
MIAVVTDTCASIPRALAESLQIELVPYYIHRGHKTLRDEVDITAGEFYQWLPSATQLPRTANPSPGDYLRAFERVSRHASQIVVLTMTSKGSGAYQSAQIAREIAATQLPHLQVYVLDTLQVAMVHGWAAIEAARAAQGGAEIAEVLATAQRVSQTGRMLKTADTLRYLYLGGRIGRAKHLVGTLLNVKPILSMQEGIIVPVGTARSIPHAMTRIIDLMGEWGAAKTPIKVAVTHAAAPERAAALLKLVLTTFDCVETLTTQLSPALGVHTGPGCVGVNFFPVR